jgi:hypothetical protein
LDVLALRLSSLNQGIVDNNILSHLVVPSVDSKEDNIMLKTDIPELFTSKLLYELESESHLYKSQVKKFVDTDSLRYFSFSS